MICCIECFKDKEVRAAIELIGHKGNCSRDRFKFCVNVKN